MDTDIFHESSIESIPNVTVLANSEVSIFIVLAVTSFIFQLNVYVASRKSAIELVTYLYIQLLHFHVPLFFPFFFKIPLTIENVA